MRMRGLEPPRDCSHSVLSAARLPVPPHPRWKLAYYWPGKMLSSNRAFQSEFPLNLAQRGDHERAMFIEAQPQFFGAAPQVGAVDRSGEGFVLDPLLYRRDFERVEALVGADERAGHEESAQLVGSEYRVFHEAFAFDAGVIGVREDGADHVFRVAALAQDFGAELRVALIRVTLVIEIVEHSHYPPFLFVLAVFAGVSPHGVFDGARVFAQAVALGPFA